LTDALAGSREFVFQSFETIDNGLDRNVFHLRADSTGQRNTF
jgi:hypothetical protein